MARRESTDQTRSLFATFYLLCLLPLPWLPEFITRAATVALPSASSPDQEGHYALASFQHLGAFLVFLDCLCQKPDVFAFPALQAAARRCGARTMLSTSALVLNVLVLAFAPGLGVPAWPGTVWQAGSSDACVTSFSSSLRHRQPSAWAALFVDMHVCLFLLPAGLLALIRLDDGQASTAARGSCGRSLMWVWAVWSLYLAGLMRSLSVMASPCVSVVSAAGLCSILRPCFRDLQRAAGASRRAGKRGGDADEEAVMALVLLAGAFLLLVHFVYHSNWVVSNVFSSPSVLLISGSNAERQKLAMLDFQEAMAFLQNSTSKNSTILSWWEYGDAIAVLGERTPIIDAQGSACLRRATWHGCLRDVSQTLLAPVDEAAARMQALGADYVLVRFGGHTGDVNDDLSKLPSLLRLAQCEPGPLSGGGGFAGFEASDADYMPHGRLGVGMASAGKATRSSLLYHLSFHRFDEVQSEYGRPKGFDRARGEESCKVERGLAHTRLEEAFTSSHWLVRVFRLRPPPEQV